MGEEGEMGELLGEYGSCVYSKECDNDQCGHINEHKIGYACMKSPCSVRGENSDVEVVEAVCIPTAAIYSPGWTQDKATFPKRARMLRPVC